MNWRPSWKSSLTLAVVCVALFRAAPSAQESHPLHWSYEGNEGPDHWGQLDPAYGTCAAGRVQSPININVKQAKLADLPQLRFDYTSTPLNIIDNGHTIQVKYAAGSTLTVGDKTYSLVQFHFHHPSEEYINNRGFDLVAHLVHDDGRGHLAVVAVLFKTGPRNPLLDTLWRNIPTQKEKAVNVPSVTFNVKDLLPADRGYYTFDGSLTTPPCSEGVTWYVLKSPSTLSADQLATFAKLYPRNARPIQPLNGREVLESR
jgi:carbonic anhydrase